MRRPGVLILALAAALLAAAPSVGRAETPPAATAAPAATAPAATVPAGPAPETANYVVLKVGGYFPMSSDLDDLEAGTGLDAEVAFGHHFSRNFALEFGIGTFSTDSDASAFIPGIGTVSASIDFDVVPVTLAAKGVFPSGSFEPYIEGGLGLYFSDTKASYSDPTITISGSESDTGFGFFLGAGFNIPVSPKAYLGAGARYHIVEISPGDSDISLDGLTVTVNLGFRF